MHWNQVCGPLARSSPSYIAQANINCSFTASVTQNSTSLLPRLQHTLTMNCMTQPKPVSALHGTVVFRSPRLAILWSGLGLWVYIRVLLVKGLRDFKRVGHE
jgi:hypothetical protein